MNGHRTPPRRARLGKVYARLLPIAGFAATLAVMGSGCGSGSHGQAPQTAPSKASESTGGFTLESKTQEAKEGAASAKYIAQADALCGRLQKQYGAHEQELTARLATLKNSGEAEAAKREETQIVQVLAVISKNRLTEFEALTPPSAGKAEVSKVITNRNKEATDLGHLAEAVVYGSRKDTESAEAAVREDNEEYSGLAERYGFKVCGQVNH